MKKIECIIRPEKLKEVEEDLRMAGAGGIMITEIRGFGKETTRPEAYIVLPKTKLEIYATDEQVEDLVSAIVKVCRTGELGDGKIAVFDIDEVIRIRTGEKANVAIL